MNKKISYEGESYLFSNINILFANKNFVKDKSILADFKIVECNQVHSNKLLPYKTDTITLECDGIYMKKQNSVAIKIKTADCLPIFTFNNNNLFAIHAGWRGLSSNIISNLQEFKFNNDSFVVIGPHIKNYEVGFEVIESLLNNNSFLKEDLNFFSKKQGTNKFNLYLEKVARYQLMNVGFKNDQIITSDLDTFSNTDLHSYRRDQKLAGRNYSYIFQTN